MNIFGCLTIVFIVLKLVELIDWSWWWVLSPIWVPIIVLLIAGILASIEDGRD